MNSSRFDILETSREGILVVDEQGLLHYLNHNAELMLACDREEAIGTPLWSIAAEWQIMLEPLLECRNVNNTPFELHHALTGRLFSLNLVPHDELTVIYFQQLHDSTAARDIREKVHDQFQDQVRETSGSLETAQQVRQYDALRDPLTDLANRFGFLDKVRRGHELAQATLLLLDIDRFRDVNDSLGHQLGDELLLTFSQRLLHSLRPEDLSARLSGDQFAVLLPNTSKDEALLVAERLQRGLEQPFMVGGHELGISIAVGVVGKLAPYDDIEAILYDADLAVHHSKSLGRGHISVFDPALREKLIQRLQLEQALRQAIDKGELEIYYQPIFDLHTNALVGLETLSRWHRPESQVSPATFIRIAEETGFIHELDLWVLERACQQQQHWQEIGFQTVPLNVNFSASHFSQGTMTARLEDILKRCAYDPTQLNLELTETVLMDESPETHQTLRDLQRLGINLHIDDFGTGYASLSYLQRFSAHSLKIDRSFVTTLGQDGKSTELVRAMLAMAHALNMKVVAEGIETLWQQRCLQDLGCDYGQGYALSKPLPARDIQPFLIAAPKTKPLSLTNQPAIV